MTKSVWLKDETAALLGRVKSELLNKEPSIRCTDDLTIRKALEGYLNGYK